MLQSAPPSPPKKPNFHHYASRRHSSSAHSPRFAPVLTSGGAPARPKPTSATPAPSPVPAFAQSQQSQQSPQTRKREYKNASTQYSPTGFPPTYRPPGLESASNDVTEPLPTTAHGAAITDADGAAATEQPEPGVRVEAEPAVPPPSSQRSRKATSEPGEPHEAPAQQTAKTSSQQEEMSPTKRARPQQPGAKTMPLKYETCDVKDLGVLISDMLMELVRLNDGIPLHDGQLTRFHSRAPPGISVRDYLNRLIVHATLSPPILLSMVFYVDKLCTMYPAFTISSLTVHRFLITAATVAAKGLSDSFWTNSLYARVGGVSLRELALLELEFLRRLEWRIVPKPETLVDYYKGLVERGEGYEMEQEDTSMTSPMVTPGDVQQQAVPTTTTATPESSTGATVGSQTDV